MEQNDKYIVVINKETGLKSAIRSKSFDGRYFEHIKSGAPVVEVTKPEIELSEPDDDLETLIQLYEAKYGKKPVGKWAKDATWLRSKLES